MCGADIDGRDFVGWSWSISILWCTSRKEREDWPTINTQLIDRLTD